MAEKRVKRPRDPLALAKLIGDIATGQVEDRVEDGKNPKFVERASKGGQVGGRARAERLSPERRREIAKKGAAARGNRKGNL